MLLQHRYMFQICFRNITIHSQSIYGLEFDDDTVGRFGCGGNEEDLYECADGDWAHNVQLNCPSQENVALNCSTFYKVESLTLSHHTTEANVGLLCKVPKMRSVLDSFKLIIHHLGNDNCCTTRMYVQNTFTRLYDD